MTDLSKLLVNSSEIDSIRATLIICGTILEEEKINLIASNSRDYMVICGPHLRTILMNNFQRIVGNTKIFR